MLTPIQIWSDQNGRVVLELEPEQLEVLCHSGQSPIY